MTAREFRIKIRKATRPRQSKQHWILPLLTTFVSTKSALKFATRYILERPMRKAITGWLLTTVWLLFGFNALTLASVPATGEFTSTKTCQAYQSIRRKTNPGGIRMEIGRRYPIMELNVSPGTTWYRLRIKNASPAERWVYFER